jgi:UPF0755 protein
MLKRIRWLLLALPLLACVPSFDEPIEPGNEEPFVFEVPKGTTPGKLGPRLQDAGLLDGTALPWDVLLKVGDLDTSCIKAGKFELKKSMTLREVMKKLCGPPMADDVAFTVIEGWRIRDIDKALAEKGFITAGAYAEVALNKSVEMPFPIESPTLEGYLYPETYKIPAGGADVKKLIARQLETFQERFLVKHPDGFGKRTLHEIVVVASMLEREEPKPVNRPIVAGIMWKRLDRKFGLGIDATSRYTLEDWNDRKAFLVKLNDPEDPYNTRKRIGLPPTAIGNPVLVSLEAAVNAQPTEFLYYLHDAQQNLHLARDAAEHEANRKKFNVY